MKHYYSIPLQLVYIIHLHETFARETLNVNFTLIPYMIRFSFIYFLFYLIIYIYIVIYIYSFSFIRLFFSLRFIGVYFFDLWAHYYTIYYNTTFMLIF